MGNKNLIKSILAFFVLFLLLSGIIGPWVIKTRLLYGFYFYIYGNLGKVLLLGAIAFLVLAKKRLNHINIPNFNKKNLIYIVLSFLLLPIFFLLAKKLLDYPSAINAPILTILTHLVLQLSVVLTAIGVFGINQIKNFLCDFKKEIKVCLGFSLILYFSIFQVWHLWPYFSKVVLHTVAFLLSLTFDKVVVFQPYTLVVQNFVVEILQACSGVDSMFLFTCLYAFIGFVDKDVLNLKKYFILVVPALIGLFMVNIARIYILVLIGVLISPEIALKLFHTYAGLVLFVIYFLVFWKVFYKWLRK